MCRVFLVLIATVSWACSPAESLAPLMDQGVLPGDATPGPVGTDEGGLAPGNDLGLDGEVSIGDARALADGGRADGGNADQGSPSSDAGPGESDMDVTPMMDSGRPPSSDGAVLPEDDAGQRPMNDDAALSPPDLGVVPVGECPAAWLTGRLVEDGDDAWAVTGNTNDTPNRTQGECGGGSGQHVYPFTAPVGGQYAVEVVGEGIGALGFAVVYVRTQCDAPETELVCDARREPRALGLVNLAAEQTVYLLVDGIHTGNFPSTGGYRLRVYRQSPPQLETGIAWMNDDNGSTILEVRGTQGNVALEGLSYRFVDAQGEVIPARGQEIPLRFGLPFTSRERDDGTTAFEGVLALNSDVAQDRRAQVAAVDLTVYDSLGAQSEILRVPVQDPDPIEIGDECDVAGARDRCPDGTECFIRDPVFDPGPACHPSGQECPAGWTSIDLADFETPNGAWRYEGNLLRQDPPLEQHNVGSCAQATGFNDLFTFTPPATGQYRFETSGMLGDTVLWVRSDCGVDGAAAELGCNDDGPGAGRFSIVDVRLEARQTVFVFVDSFGQGNRNAYLLTVSRR